MPIHPCGLATDISWHTRRITIRPYRDSDITTVIRTYFVPWDTPFVPYPHCFTDPDHLPDRGQFEGAGWIGDERYSNYKSVTPGPAMRGEICGPDDPDVWLNGGIYGVHEPLETIANYPVCCLLYDLVNEEHDTGAVCIIDHEDDLVEGFAGLAAAVGEISHIDLISIIEDGTCEAVGAISHTDILAYPEDGTCEGVGEISHEDRQAWAEEHSVEAVGEISHEDDFEPGEPPTVECGTHPMPPATLYFHSDEMCSGSVDITLTYSATAYLGGPGWYGSTEVCDGKTLEIWMYCASTYWQMVGKCDGNAIGGASTSTMQDDPFFIDGSGAFATGPGACCDTFDSYWTISE